MEIFDLLLFLYNFSHFTVGYVKLLQLNKTKKIISFLLFEALKYCTRHIDHKITQNLQDQLPATA